MSASRTVKLTWLAAAQKPFWTVLLIMASVGGLILGSQMALLAPVVPSWRGLIVVVLGLVPEMLGILGPVAALFGSVAASHTWREGGEFRGLMATGIGLSPILSAAALWGTIVGVGVAGCTHYLGPMGRGLASEAVGAVLTGASLQPGVQLHVGDVFVGVAPEENPDARVVVAGDDWIAWAEDGVITDGGIQLIGGRARSLDDAWRIQFQEAHWPLPSRPKPPHNFSRTTTRLKQHIADLEVAQRDTGRAELTLFKRTTLAMSAPLFAVMGVMLAFSRRRPVPWAVALVLGVWFLQRGADHALGVVDTAVLAAAPLGVLFGLVVALLGRLGRPE